MSVPPQFSNFGKSVTDLFKKKFEFDPLSLKTKYSADNGLTVETGAVAVKENTADSKPAYLRGFTKLSLLQKQWGAGEVEFHTDAEQTSKIQAKFTKLYPGMGLTVYAASKDKASLYKKERNVLTVEDTYQRPNFNSQFTFKTNARNAHRFDAQVSGAYENVSVGGNVVFETDSDKKSLTDIAEWNAGVEYSQVDLTASGFTNLDKNNNRIVNVAIGHRVNSNIFGGVLYKFNTKDGAKDKHTVTVGGDYKVDKNTSFRTNLEISESKRVAQLSVEHALVSPQVVFNFSSEFDVSDSLNNKKFGVGLTFGER